MSEDAVIALDRMYDADGFQERGGLRSNPAPAPPRGGCSASTTTPSGECTLTHNSVVQHRGPKVSLLEASPVSDIQI